MRLAEALFPGHPLGREVLGTEASIEAMTRDDIAGFHDRWYRPANLVVAAAGDVDHDEVARRPRRLRGCRRPAASARRGRRPSPTPVARGGRAPPRRAGPPRPRAGGRPSHDDPDR